MSGDSIQEKLILTNEEIQKMEKQTRSQSQCRRWYAYRAGRITATSAKAVCKIRALDSNMSLIKKICYPSKLDKQTDAMKWGSIHEQDAAEAYQQYAEKNHVEFKMEKCGFLIHTEYPFLGCSPDRRVQCMCCGRGIIEIKCPYTLLSKEKSRNDLEYLINGSLSQKSSYYYQIQMQLMCTKVEYCDFAIWSPNSLTIERIIRNEVVISEIIEHSQPFFQKVILPELLAKHYTLKKLNNDNDKENEPPPAADDDK